MNRRSSRIISHDNTHALERESDRFHLLTRRALILGGLQTMGVALLASRLFHLQIIDGEKYRLLSDENRISLRILAPPRGQIIDRFGVPLATNKSTFRAVLVPEEINDMDAVLANLSGLLDISESDRRRIERELKRNRSFVPVTLKENIEWDNVTKLEINTPDLPGVSVVSGDVRHYPLGESTAHLIGYVGAVSEKEMASDPVLSLPGYRVGKTGIEKINDPSLRGTAGAVQLEVNAGGRVIRELSRKAPIPAHDIQLTIDAELQHYIQERLALERSASAVVLDAHSGAVYAMASHPSYDPNIFSTGIPSDLWNSLLADETNPLTNKAIAGQYPPGSTFKMLTALAALEAGAITPTTRVSCNGHMDLGTHRFHCWKKEGHGVVDLNSAIAQSCDVYFYDISRRIGIDRIADMAVRFGLGTRSGIDMPNERAGLVPTKEWKRKHHKQPWALGETLVNAIGQGFMQATPLQLAIMTARLVNGGYAISPYLRSDEGPVRQARRSEMGLNSTNLTAIVAGMAACTAPGGTAYAAQIPDPTMQMGGKTGTSQVRRISMAERAAGLDVNTLEWRFRHHALFVGFAPLHAPRYVTCAVIEHGGSGGGVAAPLGRDILWRTQQRDPGRS